MKPQLIVIDLLLSCLVYLSAIGTSRADTGTALAELKKVEALSFGGIGVAGTTSPGDLLFRELAAAPNKATTFIVRDEE
jgi:hypothetical protein